MFSSEFECFILCERACRTHLSVNNVAVLCLHHTHDVMVRASYSTAFPTAVASDCHWVGQMPPLQLPPSTTMLVDVVMHLTNYDCGYRRVHRPIVIARYVVVVCF